MALRARHDQIRNREPTASTAISFLAFDLLRAFDVFGGELAQFSPGLRIGQHAGMRLALGRLISKIARTL